MFSIRDWILNGSFALVTLIIGALTAVVAKATLFVVIGILLALLAVITWLIFVYGKKGPSIPPDNA